MADWIAGGRVVDIALALAAIEAAGLLAWHGRTGRGIPARALLPNLASGGALLLALRVALGGGWWGWIAACLAAALLAHLGDLRARWNILRH